MKLYESVFKKTMMILPVTCLIHGQSLIQGEQWDENWCHIWSQLTWLTPWVKFQHERSFQWWCCLNQGHPDSGWTVRWKLMSYLKSGTPITPLSEVSAWEELSVMRLTEWRSHHSDPDSGWTVHLRFVHPGGISFLDHDYPLCEILAWDELSFIDGHTNRQTHRQAT